ncbi:MAG: tetratricopeptide repeat protein [Myxococcota bacterium]
MTERRIVRALLAACALSVLAACGGSQQVSVNELPPADPEAVREYNAGTRLLRRGGVRNTRRARARFEQALTIDPNLWEARFDLGVLQREAGELDAARSSFASVIETAPQRLEPRLAMAEVAYRLGDRREAADQLRTVLERDPENVNGRLSLAVILRENEDYDEALDAAREVLIRNPQSAPALLEVGRIYRAREQYEVSRLVLQKALTIVEEEEARLRAEILNEQGLLELARGDTQAAFTAFEGAIAAEAGFAPARMNMGSVLLRAGDFAGAKSQYESVLQVSPDRIDARIGLGVALRGEGDHRAAQRQYEAVLEDDEQNADALFNMAVLEADFLDRRPAARTRFQTYMRVAPSDHPGRSEAERYLREIPDPNAAPPTP